MYKQLIVSQHDRWVVDDPTPGAELTLTSCHPKGFATQRIVIKARLVANRHAAVPKPPVPTTAPFARSRGGALLGPSSIDGPRRPITPAFLWGLIVALVGLGWWWGFRRWRHPLVWIAGVPPFLAVLFPFYVFLERALPSGY